MDEKIVAIWDRDKEKLREVFASAHPEDYSAVVKAVVGMLSDGWDEAAWRKPDPNRIHLIDDGDYQGTLVFVIAETGYQPSAYWYVRVGYGSCSGCDTLEAIRSYSSDAPTGSQISEYMTLALHVVQGINKMGGDEA